MSKSTQPVQTPGEGFTDEQTPEQRRIADLEAQLAKYQANEVAVRSVGAAIEMDTPHGEAAKAASKHLHLTTDEAMKAGVDRTVLCKDGWFVPPTLRAA